MQPDHLLTLRALDALSQDERTSQRALSRKLGVSLGHTNLLLKRMAQRGLIKLKTIPGNRILYALTPKGVAEKARKTIDWLRFSHHYLVSARERVRGPMQVLVEARCRRVACLGRSELFEVVLLAASELGLRVVALVEPAGDGETFCGVPVVVSAEAAVARGAQGAIRLRDGPSWLDLPLVDIERYVRS